MNKADIDYIIEKLDSYKPDNIYDGCNSVKEKQDQRVCEVLDSLKTEFESYYETTPEEFVFTCKLNNEEMQELKKKIFSKKQFDLEPVKNSWIKCSDRMPGESKDVLFIRKTWGSNKEICIGHYNSKMKWWQKGSGVIKSEDVTHWIQLPSTEGLDDAT